MKYFIILAALMLTGCSTEPNYDGLQVVDGSGRVFTLHKILGSNYTIEDMRTGPSDVEIANQKLKEIINEGSNKREDIRIVP